MLKHTIHALVVLALIFQPVGLAFQGVDLGESRGGSRKPGLDAMSASELLTRAFARLIDPPLAACRRDRHFDG